MRSDGSSRRRSGRGDEREQGSVEMWAVTLSLICELERTRACTLYWFKQTYVYNTITLSQEHPRHRQTVFMGLKTRRFHGIFKEQNQKYLSLSCSVGVFVLLGWLLILNSVFLCWIVPKYVLIYESSIHRVALFFPGRRWISVVSG